MLLHPGVAYRDCAHCEKFHYDEDTGEVHQWRGQPMERRGNDKAPCRMKPDGCPKGTPEEPKSLTPKNRQAYHYYLECKAVGEFPRDPIVRRNAALIAQVLADVAEAKQTKAMYKLAEILLAVKR